MNLTVPQLMKTKDHQLSNQSMNLRTSPRFQSELLRCEWNKDGQQSDWIKKNVAMNCWNVNRTRMAKIQLFIDFLKIPPHSAMNEKRHRKPKYAHTSMTISIVCWDCEHVVNRPASCMIYVTSYNTWRNTRQYYWVSLCLSWFP